MIAPNSSRYSSRFRFPGVSISGRRSPSNPIWSVVKNQGALGKDLKARGHRDGQRLDECSPAAGLATPSSPISPSVDHFHEPQEIAHRQQEQKNQYSVDDWAVVARDTAEDTLWIAIAQE